MVVFDHAFHGRSLLAMTMTAKNQPYKKSFGPFAPEVYRAPMAYPYRWPSGTGQLCRRGVRDVRPAVDAQLGADAVAAVVVEPIQGEGGFIVPAAGSLPRVAEFCRDRGILLVADEVQTGIARTGAWFACEHEGLVPDLITTAKGWPAGCRWPRSPAAPRMDAAHQGGIGGTYAGNPVACAAAPRGLRGDRVRWPDEAPARSASSWCPVARHRRSDGRHRRDPRPRRDDRRRTGASRHPRTRPAAVAAVARYRHDNGVLTLTAGTFRERPALPASAGHLRRAPPDAFGVLRGLRRTLRKDPT